MNQANRPDSDRRQRQEGGGRKQTLLTGREKLCLIVFYVTCYATCDVLAWLFDVDRAQTHRWVTTFLPVLDVYHLHCTTTSCFSRFGKSQTTMPFENRILAYSLFL